jgi:hypothetical protein
VDFILNKGNERRARGASFCHVVSRRALVQESEVITDGNQK